MFNVYKKQVYCSSIYIYIYICMYMYVYVYVITTASLYVLSLLVTSVRNEHYKIVLHSSIRNIHLLAPYVKYFFMKYVRSYKTQQ
jgi:hypothetical protein